MKYTLAHYRGAVLAKLGAPRMAIPAAALDLEINAAVQEVWDRIKQAHNEHNFEQATDALVANLDIYPLPTNCYGLLLVERLDRGEVAIPMVPVPFQTSAQQRWLGGAGNDQPWTYQRLPGGKILLIQKPTYSVDPGIRYSYIPKVQELVKASDSPTFSEEIHECVVPLAALRCSLYANVQVLNPRLFMEYAKRMDAKLDSFLQPSNSEGGAAIQDFDSNFIGGPDNVGW